MPIPFKKYNVSKPREVALKDGTTKTFWDNVGHVTIFTKEDGTESGKLELFSFASKTIELNIFAFKPQEANTANNKNNYSQPSPANDYSQPEPEEEIRVENIPF